MSWATGLILFCLALIALWAVAELWPRGRQWIKRVDSISQGRAHQQAEYMAANTFYPHGDTNGR
jgi:hypothetical protein